MFPRRMTNDCAVAWNVVVCQPSSEVIGVRKSEPLTPRQRIMQTLATDLGRLSKINLEVERFLTTALETDKSWLR